MQAIRSLGGNTMALTALDRSEDRISAPARDDVRNDADGLDSQAIRRDDVGPGYLLRRRRGHPLLGRRMPDLDLVTPRGPLRVFTLLHQARPVLLNLGEPGSFEIAPWADRVQSVDARYDGTWELPAIGAVTAPAAVLIRPDGYVSWVGDRTQLELTDALTTWFGSPAAAQRIGIQDQQALSTAAGRLVARH